MTAEVYVTERRFFFLPLFFSFFFFQPESQNSGHLEVSIILFFGSAAHLFSPKLIALNSAPPKKVFR